MERVARNSYYDTGLVISEIEQKKEEKESKIHRNFCFNKIWYLPYFIKWNLVLIAAG